MSEVSIGLSAGNFCQAFPFHFVVDQQFIIRQLGPGLVKIARDTRPGVGLQDAFELRRPLPPCTVQTLESNINYPFLIAHRRTGIVFRGQFLALEDGLWAFLGSPWFESTEALEKSGLHLSDFAVHDPVADLLMASRTQSMAMDDLRQLTQRLAGQRAVLIRTEDLYRRAISAARAVPYREDLETGDFEFVGEGIEALTGYPSGEMTPALFRSLIVETSELPASDATQTEAMADGPMPRRRDVCIRSRSGQLRWVNDSSVLVLGPEGRATGSFGIFTDITARKRVEARLRASEEDATRLAMVAARTDNAVILTDASRRIQWVNDGFTRLTGYTLSEVAGSVPGHVLQGDDVDAATVEYIRSRLEKLQGFQCEIRNRRKDGSSYWTAIECQPIHDAQGRHTGFMAIESDITDRKRYEDRLEQLSNELDTILKLSPDGYVAFDAVGKLSYCNPAFEQIVVRELQELRGLGYEDVDRLLCAVSGPEAAFAPILSIEPGEPDRMHLGGPPKRVISRAIREVRNPRGSVHGRVLFLRDITQEDEMARMKSEFLSTAAHELRTPMTSVQGFSELLMNEELDRETARDVAATIHRQSSILVNMVNELLDLQRIEQLGGQDFELSRQPVQPLLRQVVANLHVRNDERRVIMPDLEGEPVWVNIDSRKIGQALMNVLSNAYKYSARGESIAISLEHRPRNGSMEVGIVVSDHGIGMSDKQLGRAFERFYRVDPSGAIPGTGLGLSLVKEIVELHDGKVELASKLGDGTTIKIWLPQVE